MPIIPDATDITRALPSGQQSVVNMPIVDTGLGALSQGIGQAAQAHQDKLNNDAKAEYSGALLKMKIAAETENHAYDNDAEWGTIGSRSDESITKARGEIGDTISDPRLRAEFDDQSELIALKTGNHVKKVAWVKERDAGRAEIDALSDDTRKAAMTGNPGEVMESYEAHMADSVKRNMITAQEAETQIADMKNSVAEGRLNMMEPEDRLEALKMPFAQNLDPDVIVKMEREAKAETVKLKAIDTVDGLDMDAPRSENLEVIDGIVDKKERAAAEVRYTAEKAQYDAATQETRLASYNDLSMFVEGDGKYDEISQDKLAELTPTMRSNLRQLDIGKTTKRTTSDPDTYDRATTLAANGQWRELNMHLSNFGSNLTDTDRKKFSDGAAEGTAPSSVSDQQIIAGLLQGDSDKIKNGRIAMLPRVSNWRTDYVKTYGKEPTQGEVEKEIERRTKPVVNPDGGYNLPWDKDLIPYQVDDRSNRNDALSKIHMKELQEEDPAAWNDTVAYRQMHGTAGNRHDFEMVFKNQQYINDLKGRKNPDIQSVVADVDAYFSGKTPTQEEWINAVTRVSEARNATQ